MPLGAGPGGAPASRSQRLKVVHDRDHRIEAAGHDRQYSFDYDDGSEGTDLSTKQFYVMLFLPAPPAAA